MSEHEDLVKKTIRLYSGDAERLEEYYPKSGYNRVIRTLVRRHLRTLDANVAQRSAPQNDQLDIEL